MRLTYSSIKSAHFRNIGKYNQFSDAALLEDFNYALGTRYQTIFASLDTYINQDSSTASTVIGTQYYSYPQLTATPVSVTATIGTLVYTLKPIYDQQYWDEINSINTFTSNIPQYYFPRQYDFGVWPIPSSVFTLTFNKYFRDRNLQVDDYSTGTIALTLGSTTVTGTSTVFTADMAGRWLNVTSTTSTGHGIWYRISSFTNSTTLVLANAWTGATGSGLSYTIGESPELPEEAHILLPAGTAADFYAGLRNDNVNATWWNNVFWTGDGNNSTRDMSSKNVTGGLIGLNKRYTDRDKDIIVNRRPGMINIIDKVWATTLS